MKTINFTNTPDFEAMEAAGIILTCDENMDYVISDGDYKRMEDEFPAAFDDSYIVCNTMQDLADYINAADEWPADVEEIIERNGWVSDTGDIYGVCHNDSEKVIMDGDGKAVVTSCEPEPEERR